MSRGPVIVRAVGRHTVELDGPGVYDVCEDLGIDRMRPTTGAKVWWISQARAEEAMAALTARGFNLVVTL